MRDSSNRSSLPSNVGRRVYSAGPKRAGEFLRRRGVESVEGPGFVPLYEFSNSFRRDLRASIISPFSTSDFRNFTSTFTSGVGR